VYRLVDMREGRGAQTVLNQGDETLEAPQAIFVPSHIKQAKAAKRRG
jgi:hypothetical protein